jgi:hypothetical protein
MCAYWVHRSLTRPQQASYSKFCKLEIPIILNVLFTERALKVKTRAERQTKLRIFAQSFEASYHKGLFTLGEEGVTKLQALDAVLPPPSFKGNKHMNELISAMGDMQIPYLILLVRFRSAALDRFELWILNR